MALLGREIIQSRVWIDPSAPIPPELNYKETFPITVFEAVRKDMNDPNSINLQTVIDDIYKELYMRQMKFDGKPSNYIMTFAGTPGAVGSIEMTREIPWDHTKWTHDKIPTEKAVGDLMQKLGLIDEDGNPINPGEVKVRWSDIIGRPLIYDSPGDHEDGFMTQKAVTQVLKEMGVKVDDFNENINNQITAALKALSSHQSNKNNPHDVTISQIGAAAASDLDEHITNYDNPHKVTVEQLNLENVDNTADIDKPISTATQAALDAIIDLINTINGDISYIKDIDYDQKSGNMTITFRDDTTKTIHIPIDGLVDDIKYDEETKTLVVYELGGNINTVDLSDLYVRYEGSSTSTITVETYEGTEKIGQWIIKATINPKSVTDKELDDDAVITRTIKEQAVTTEKIKDKAVTGDKLADGTITGDNIGDRVITSDKLADRSVNGRSLFSSSVANRVLGVLDADSDPKWLRIIADMISSDAIETRHIKNLSVTVDKLATNSVTTPKIEDEAVTTEKIADYAVTNDKIDIATITGNRFVEDIDIPGTPTIGKRPAPNADNNEIPDTKWVNEFNKSYVNDNSNLGNRSVNGRVLFTSPNRHRVLAVLRANSDPVWSLIDHDMLEDDIIDTKNIMDLAISGDKIKDKSIFNKHLNANIIKEDNIVDNSVTSMKIFASEQSNMVLASIKEFGHPIYTKIVREMLEYNVISSMQIEDGAVTPSKIETSDQPHRVLGVILKGTNPIWTQITTQMLQNRAVTGSKLFTSDYPNRVLGVHFANDEPFYVQVNSGMIEDRAVKREHIGEREIWGEHIVEKAIESKHIMDWTIQTNNIAPNAITGTELFTSPIPNRVLAVTSMPYSDPDWMQIVTDMVEDEAITGEKIFRSDQPYRVLAVTQAGTPPEYLMITAKFIVDDSITPAKLVRDFTLYGTPQLTYHPEPDADNHQLASTKWVRQTVHSMIRNFETLYGTIYNEMIADNVIDGRTLFTSPYDGPRVLGVTAKGEQVEFLLIENAMIADGAITTDKIQRDLHLLGSPILDVRPSPHASDNAGGGNLIPDCQWVVDQISNAVGGYNNDPDNTINPNKIPEFYVDDNGNLLYEDSDLFTFGINGNGDLVYNDNSIYDFFITTDGRLAYNVSGSGIFGDGGSGGKVADGSITTSKIQDRAVTGDKLFTSTISNRVLAVLGANTNPVYTQLINDMVADRAINGRTLFTSSAPNRILGVINANGDPEWTQINHGMIGYKAVDTNNIADEAVTTDKLAKGAVTRETVADEPVIDTVSIFDNAITNDKIKDKSVTTEKIADHTIMGKNIEPSVTLSGTPTVEPTNDLEKRSIRNTIISPNSPTGGCHGDIWFRYA